MQSDPVDLAKQLEQIIRQVVCGNSGSCIRGLKIRATFDYDELAGQLVPDVSVEIQESTPVNR